MIFLLINVTNNTTYINWNHNYTYKTPVTAFARKLAAKTFSFRLLGSFIFHGGAVIAIPVFVDLRIIELSYHGKISGGY